MRLDSKQPRANPFGLLASAAAYCLPQNFQHGSLAEISGPANVIAAPAVPSQTIQPRNSWQ